MLLSVILAAGCGYTAKYSLSGASIPAEAKTFSVAYFLTMRPWCRLS